MATNLREFFSSISTNIELGEDFDLNSIPEDVNLPDGFKEQFHNNFLTPLAAKNNEGIRSHFRGQYLSTIDSRAKASFIANGGTEEAFRELKEQEPDSMKLIDLVVNNLSELKSKQTAPSSNKEFEAYKIQTATQIQELLGEKASFEEKLNASAKEINSEWAAKLQKSTLNSKLNSKQFNEGMSREDSILLTLNKIDNSPYILKLDENLQEKVYQKDNPENIAIADGVELTWDKVVDQYSYDYIKKNDQAPAQAQAPATVVTAPASSEVDGRYIVGHKDYNKF